MNRGTLEQKSQSPSVLNTLQKVFQQLHGSTQRRGHLAVLIPAKRELHSFESALLLHILL